MKIATTVNTSASNLSYYQLLFYHSAGPFFLCRCLPSNSFHLAANHLLTHTHSHTYTRTRTLFIYFTWEIKYRFLLLVAVQLQRSMWRCC